MSQFTTGKNDVSLELHWNNDTENSLTKVCFYTSPSQKDDVDPIEAFAQNVLS